MTEASAIGRPAFRESSAPYYQQVVANDPKPAPDLFRDYSEADLPLVSVPRSEYTSPEFAKLEQDRMWSRVWQMACREEQIPEPGDCHVYEGPGVSILVIRGDDDKIRAFYNSCTHRGMKLCATDTSVSRITCPFHSFTWNLDGSVAHIPARWDFPGLKDEAVRLREIRAECWQGFVFINRDADAPPLEEYLGKLVPHFADWRFDDMYLEATMRKTIDANWKTCIEAFLEAYHLSGIHPQALPFGGDSSVQYDVWPDDPHVSRFIEPTGIASDQFPRELSEQEVLKHMVHAVFGNDAEVPEITEGMSARLFLGAGMRATFGAAHGRDYSHLSDTEAADAVQYTLFPNFVIFRSLAYPFVYRFLPVRDDPGKTTFDFLVLKPKPESGEIPEARMIELGLHQSYNDAGLLPPWQALIYDQDADGLRQCQDGMRDGGDGDILYSSYQESRIRLLHHTLARYVSDNPNDAPGR